MMNFLFISNNVYMERNIWNIYRQQTKRLRRLDDNDDDDDERKFNYHVVFFLGFSRFYKHILYSIASSSRVSFFVFLPPI